MEVGIVAQRGNAQAVRLAGDVTTLLADKDVTSHVDPSTAAALDVPETPVEEFAECDLVVSIGGDGTFLFAARGAGSTPILGVNLGEVGFLNAVAPENAIETVAREVDRYRRTGSIRYRDVPRVRACWTDGWELTPALNEVTVQGTQRGHANGVDLEVRVDDSHYSTASGDGFLVATPTGSSAYNLSEGGPLVHPRVGGLIVTSMCAAGAMPPLVVPLESEIEIVIDGAAEAVVSSDGATHRTVSLPTAVSIRAAEEPARVAGPVSDFFEALNKLE